MVKNIDTLIDSDSVIAFDGVGNNVGKKSIIIQAQDDSGKPILVAIEPRNIDRSTIELNVIVTIHKRNDIRSTILKANDFYLNEKSIDWLTSLGLQLPSGANIHASTDIINEYQKVFNGLNNNYIETRPAERIDANNAQEIAGISGNKICSFPKMETGNANT